MTEGASSDRPADGLITLYEAAERLGVHYMTVYRYVRTGRLPGRKVGVEWRVDPADLEVLVRPAAMPPTAPGPGEAPRRRRIDYGGRLVERLVAGDERGSWSIVQSALSSGLDPDDVYLDVLAPALKTIGEQWAAGRVSVGQEHQASVVVLRLIGRLGPLFTRRGRTRGTIVLGAPPGDHHSLPGALFADLLRGLGLGVVDLGADTPASSFVEAARHAERLVAVAVTVTTPGNDAVVIRTVHEIRRSRDVPVVVGGGDVRTAERAAALGSETFAADEPTALALFSRLADAAGRTRKAQP